MGKVTKKKNRLTFLLIAKKKEFLKWKKKRNKMKNQKKKRNKFHNKKISLKQKRKKKCKSLI